jgi:cytochrome c-type biogenesis protein CcmE
VVNTGSPPALFQKNIPVVVVGHFSSDTSRQFESNTIEVKHSATYTAQHPNRVAATAASAC